MGGFNDVVVCLSHAAFEVEGFAPTETEYLSILWFRERLGVSKGKTAYDIFWL